MWVDPYRYRGLYVRYTITCSSVGKPLQATPETSFSMEDFSPMFVWDMHMFSALASLVTPGTLWGIHTIQPKACVNIAFCRAIIRGKASNTPVLHDHPSRSKGGPGPCLEKNVGTALRVWSEQ